MDDILRIFAGRDINQGDRLDLVEANHQLMVRRPQQDAFQPGQNAIVTAARDRIQGQLTAAYQEAKAAAEALVKRARTSIEEDDDPFNTPVAQRTRSHHQTARGSKRKRATGTSAFTHEWFPTASKFSWKTKSKWRKRTIRRSTLRRRTKARSFRGR